MADGSNIVGSKGGASEPRTPVTAPDSLLSIARARIMDLLSEGECYGWASGPGHELEDYFLNETPIANPDGTLNFKDVVVDWRTGTQDQTYIEGFPSVESEVAVGVELLNSTPWTHAFTNLSLSGVRVRLSVAGLQKTDNTTGDVSGYKVDYAIDLSTNGGAFQQVGTFSMNGKASTKYERSHRVDLPPQDSGSGWIVRVRRLTADSTDPYIADTTKIESYTEIIDAKFRYPNSAVVSIAIDSSQFSSIPRRAFRWKGLIIQVPSNYNPDTRVYTGIWDGTFMPAWTNNPAWIYYDMVTQDRYGLGHAVDANLIDKWALYKIAKYCDEWVPSIEPLRAAGVSTGSISLSAVASDQSVNRASGSFLADGFVVGDSVTLSGFGDPANNGDAVVISVTALKMKLSKSTSLLSGASAAGRSVVLRTPLEPRFTCTAYLQRKADAYKVLQDLASAFRGLAYWAGGAIIASQDAPDDPVYTYNNTNVVDGKFHYQGTARRARHSLALVGWNDPADFGRGKVEPVEDEESLLRFGMQEITTTCFGGTSAGQAQRVGRWILGSEKYEKETVSFQVGYDGVLVAPGKVIRIADETRAGRRLGGRVVSVNAAKTQVVVDKLPAVAPVAGDKLYCISPDGLAMTGIVSSTDVATRTITVSPAFPSQPVAQSVWAIETVDLAPATYRVLTVAEGEEATFQLTALQHEPQKYAYVDYGTPVNPKPTSLLPGTVQQPPAKITLRSFERAGEVIASIRVDASWDKAPNATAYSYQWQRDNEEWSAAERVTGTHATREAAFPGVWRLRVWSHGSNGISSRAVLSHDLVVADQSMRPGFVEGLQTTIDEALQTAQNAQATADGSIISFWQTDAPVIGSGAGKAKEGDIWFDTNDGNKIYRVVSGTWALAQDDQIALALAAASNAQSTADGKVRTYFGATAPAGTKAIGDLWFDTNDKKLYRWDGTDWSQQIGDITLDQIAGNGVNILWNEYVTYNSPLPTITPIYGGPGPTYSAGDNAVGGGGSLMVVTDTTNPLEGLSLGVTGTDYNLPIKAGRYIASFFVKASVAGHKVAMGTRRQSDATFELMPDYSVINANTWERASGVIDLRGDTSLKAALPTIFTNRSGVAGRTVKVDGLMLEPMVGNMEFPSGFTAGKAGKQALVAIANAAYAQATADGKITTFFQDAIPSGSEGDLWFDTDDGNKIYTYKSGAWIATPDSRIAQAIADAAGAQATADGKVQTFYQEATPTATGIGDLWYQESTKSIYRWDGASWGETVEGAPANSLNLVKKSTFEDGKIGSWGLNGDQALVTAALGGYTKQIQMSATATGIYEIKGWFDAAEGEIYRIYAKVNGNGHGATGFTRLILHCVDKDGGTTGFVEAARLTGIGARDLAGDATVPALTVKARVAVFVGGASFSWSRFTKVQCNLAGVRNGASGWRLGDARNNQQSQTTAYGSVRTTTALTATSAGAISINAHSVRYGGVSVSYSAVANAITGKAQGTTWVIYCRDPDYEGGVRTWYAASSPSAAMNIADDVVVAGQITIPTSGSSSGGTGGGGFECVDWDTLLPDGRLLRECVPGDLIECVDVSTGETGMFPLRAIGFGEEECYRLVTPELASVVQSKSTPMDLPDGSVRYTPEMFGRQVYVKVNGEVKLSFVSDLVHLGVRKVVKPDLGNRMLFAGERAEAAIGTHNVIWKP